MMPVPAPPRPGGPDHSPAPAPYTPPSERNAAAITSLVCAILWPLVLVAVLLWNASHCTTTVTGTYICTYTTTDATPTWFSTLTGFFLIALPPLGLISGGVGLVRSFTRPLLCGARWQAIVGLLFCLMWLAFTLLDWL